MTINTNLPDCASCLSQITDQDRYYCLKSGRLPAYHTSCVREWAIIRDNEHREPTCPHPGCKEDISHLLPNHSTFSRTVDYFQKRPITTILTTGISLLGTSLTLGRNIAVAATKTSFIASLALPAIDLLTHRPKMRSLFGMTAATIAASSGFFLTTESWNQNEKYNAVMTSCYFLLTVSVITLQKSGLEQSNTKLCSILAASAIVSFASIYVNL